MTARVSASLQVPRLDFHTHIGPFPSDQPAEALVAMLDANEVNYAVVFPSKGLHASPRVYARANEYVAEAMQRYPSRLFGFCTVNPGHADEAIDELNRAVGELGLRGLKLHPPTQGFDVFDQELLFPLMQAARSLGIPVAIHGGLREHDNPLRFHLLGRAFPDVRLVMLHANFGGSDRVAIRWAAENTPNLYFETSATTEPAFVAALVGWSGPDRVFYGSDWPWLPPRLMRAVVEYSGLPESGIAAILGGNAARILNLSV